MYFLLKITIILNSIIIIWSHPQYRYQHINPQIFTNDRFNTPRYVYRFYPNRLTKPIFIRQQIRPPIAKIELDPKDNNNNNKPSTETYIKPEPEVTTLYNSDEPDSTEETKIVQKYETDVSTTPTNDGEVLKAVAVLRGEAKGVLNFHQIGDKVRVYGFIKSLTNGLHAFHVHDFGDLRRSCDSSGDHFNPFKTKHGSPFDSIRHVGDLGNVFADESGIAKIDMQDQFLTLRPGKNNIIGHAIIVHEGVDDLGRGGHVKSGRRVGCGIIGWLNDLE